MIKTITPPKGIRKKNTEGSELLDCEGEENQDINEVLEGDEEIENSEISQEFYHDLDVEDIVVFTQTPKLVHSSTKCGC